MLRRACCASRELAMHPEMRTRAFVVTTTPRRARRLAHIQTPLDSHMCLFVEREAQLFPCSHLIYRLLGLQASSARLLQHSLRLSDLSVSDVSLLGVEPLSASETETSPGCASETRTGDDPCAVLPSRPPTQRSLRRPSRATPRRTSVSSAWLDTNEALADSGEGADDSVSSKTGGQCLEDGKPPPPKQPPTARARCAQLCQERRTAHHILSCL